MPVEETLKLVPSKRKWIVLGSVFVLFAVGFAVLYASTPRVDPSDDSPLVIGSLIVLFAVGAAASFMMLLPGRAYLLLTPEGFTAHNVFKSRTFRWAEIDSFSVMPFRGTRLVVFTLSPEGKLRTVESVWRKLNKAVGGGDDNLPDTYGMSPEALADLMNQWRKKAAGQYVP
jgi:hypothetical protein